MTLDLGALAAFDKAALLTSGTESAPFLRIPDRYVELVTTFAQSEGR